MVIFGRQSWPKPPNLNARLTAACVHNILRQEIEGGTSRSCFIFSVLIAFYLVDMLLNIVSNINDMI